MKYLLLLLLLVCSAVHAQPASNAANEPEFQTAIGSKDAPAVKEIPTMQPGAASEQVVATAATSALQPTISPPRREWSDFEVYLTIGLLVFTLIALGMLVHLARNAEKPWSPQSILRVFGITLIIPMAVLLIVAGYSEKQIASVIGLLGVIAGYLLGNGDRPRTGA